jgi:hypothetical protein
VALRGDGSPLFQLEQSATSTADNVIFIAKVSSFEYLNKVLKIADEMKLRELQDILQGKLHEIFSVMGGARF